MAKFVSTIAGAALIGTGLFLEFVTIGASTPLTAFLISAGIGMVMSGIGTMLAKGPLAGTSTASRNPIAPWNVVYGRAKVGGALIYFGEFGDNDKYLDMVFVLACHQCKSVDALLFDGQRIQISTNAGPFNGVSGDSFTPVQQNLPISHISRANNVVTVVLLQDIPLLQAGDNVIIQNISGDYTLNGRFPVEQLISQVYAPGTPGSVTFTYLCGGPPAIVDNEGQCLTTWPDYGKKVHMEVLLGNHTATVPGMLNGTPNDGDSGDLIQFTNNPWSAAHKCLGRTVVFLRLHYNDQYFASGLPSISFLVSGKNDISDPRTSPPTIGFTENPVLCIGDYLTNIPFGFRAPYGTEVPIPQLIAAANMCEEAMPLASGAFEPRYLLDGSFPLTMKRGEVLQNLLTSCCGRITFNSGQFVIQPAGWPGVSFQLGPPSGLPAVIASAVISVTSSFTGGTGYGAYAGFYLGAIGIFAFNAAWLFDGFGWTKRTDTHVMDAGEILAVQNGSMHAQFDIEGSIFGDSVPETQLCIYDTWIDVVFVDGTTGRWVPYSVSTVAGSSGSISNPERATDGDPTTCAIVHRSHFSSLGSGYVLQLGGYGALPIPGSPDSSATGVAATGHALAHSNGPFRWRPKVSIRDLYNGCKGTYVSPVNKWQVSDFPPYAQDTLHGYASGSPLDPFGDANLAADGGDRRWLDIQLPFTISWSMAQRLAKIELMRRRQQGTGTFVYDMALYQATALDVFQMTLPLLGWTNKLLEISAFRFTLEKVNSGGREVTLLGTQLDVQDTDPSVYAWAITEELSPEGYQQASMPTNVGTLDDLYTVNGT